jgi:predicted short-subunit dehydrogenase-like oxidoreductase (DUF2520 family)
MMPIHLIGTGNLAKKIAIRLEEKEIAITSIISRSIDRAQDLANKYNANSIQLNHNLPDEGMFLLCVNDDSIEPISALLDTKNGMVIHFSGSKSFNNIAEKHKSRGVIWPLQSFTASSNPNWDNIPLIYSYDGVDFESFVAFMNVLSKQQYGLSKDEKAQLHLAAVLVNNFTNLLYTEAEKRLTKSNVSFELLLPILQQMITQLQQVSPAQTQSGPAKRGDLETLQKHLNLLDDDLELQEIYKLLSKRINPELKL